MNFVVLLLYYAKEGLGGNRSNVPPPRGFPSETPFPVRTGTGEKPPASVAAPGCGERVPGRERGRPPLPHPGALKRSKGVSQPPPGDVSDPAVTKALFSLIAPEPKM